MFICKFESVNSSLIKRIFRPKSSPRSSSRFSLMDTITGSFPRSFSSSFLNNKNNDHHRPYDSLINTPLLNSPLLSSRLTDKSLVARPFGQSFDNSQFIITESLPKNIPLKSPRKVSKSSSQKLSSPMNAFHRLSNHRFNNSLYSNSSDKARIERMVPNRPPANSKNENQFSKPIITSSSDRPRSLIKSFDDEKFNMKSSNTQSLRFSTPGEQMVPSNWPNIAKMNVVSNNQPTANNNLPSDSHINLPINSPINSPISSSISSSISSPFSSSISSPISSPIYSPLNQYNESPLGSLPFDNSPLPIDSPLIFNTSLIKQYRPMIGLPNIPLSTMNFYYLAGDKPDRASNEHQLSNYDYLNYLHQECMKLNAMNGHLSGNEATRNNVKKKNNNDLNRNDTRNQIIKLNSLGHSPAKTSTSNRPKKPTKANHRKSTKKSTRKHKKGKKKSSTKNKKLTLTKSTAKLPMLNYPPIDTILSHQSNNILNYQSVLNSQPDYQANQLNHQSIYQLNHQPNYQDNYQIEHHLTGGYPINGLNVVNLSSEQAANKQHQINQSKNANKFSQSKSPLLRTKSKKPNKNRLVNSSSNDRYVVVKAKNTKSKSPPKSSKPTKSAKQPNKLRPKSSVELTTKPSVVYKNMIYLNKKKDNKQEMLDAFHQSTLEEDLNIIKEIINDYNVLGNKNPVVNQYYLANDNQHAVEDNYVLENLVNRPHANSYAKPMNKPGAKPKKKKNPSINNSGRRYPFFGFPLSNVHSNDMFDQETTYEEKMFEKNYPYR